MAQLFSDSEQEMVTGRLGKRSEFKALLNQCVFNLNKTQNLMYSNIQNI